MKLNRRDALKSVATALSIPILAGLSEKELMAFGSRLHAEASAAPQGRHIFRTLDFHQNRTVGTIADLIIPPTDTPGALDAGVNEFIDLILTDQVPIEQREKFLKGIEELDDKCRQDFGKTFIDCTSDQQTRTLEELEEAAMADPSAHSDNPPFFLQIKHLTLFGYYTSEVGMLDELGWVMVPGTFTGCAAETKGN